MIHNFAWWLDVNKELIGVLIQFGILFATVVLIATSMLQARAASMQAKAAYQQVEAANQQVKVSIDQAKIAEYQAASFVNSERPWVFVDASQSQEATIHFRAVNYGNSPAEIIFDEIRHLYADHVCLPEEPGFDTEKENFYRRVLVPKDSIQVYEFDALQDAVKMS